IGAIAVAPSDPNVIYVGTGAGIIRPDLAVGNGMYKSTDAGATWTQLGLGDTQMIAMIAVDPHDPNRPFVAVLGHPYGPNEERGVFRSTGGGVIGFYKSVDAGAHWTLVNGTGVTGRQPDNRPLGRIGGGDLPELAVDPKNPSVVYTCSTVFWRTEDGGLTWSAVRGAPGGDDYQQMWINPNNPDILIVVSDQGGVVSANRGASWSNWYTQP